MIIPLHSLELFDGALDLILLLLGVVIVVLVPMLDAIEPAEGPVHLGPKLLPPDIGESFMVIFEVKGIEAHGEEAQNNECQRFHFLRLIVDTL